MAEVAVAMAGGEASPADNPLLNKWDSLFAGQITAEVDRQASLVDQVDSGRSRLAAVCEFRDSGKSLEDPSFYITHRALSRLLDGYGLLRAYYQPNAYAELASWFEGEQHQRLLLRRPDGCGTFAVTFAFQTDPDSGQKTGFRQSVVYHKGKLHYAS